MKSQQICVRVTDELYLKLKELAELEDRSVSYIVNKVLEEIFIKGADKGDV